MQISDESQNEEHLSLYAASLIEVLRKQLNSERLAHTRTRDLANAQLLELNAKLSRRDAELESCIASAEHFRSPREGHDFGTGDARREMARITDGCDLMSPDEMNSLSDLTAVRNKILETEVKMARRVSVHFLLVPLSSSKFLRLSLRKLEVPEDGHRDLRQTP